MFRGATASRAPLAPALLLASASGSGPASGPRWVTGIASEANAAPGTVRVSRNSAPIDVDHVPYGYASVVRCRPSCCAAARTAMASVNVARPVEFTWHRWIRAPLARATRTSSCMLSTLVAPGTVEE